MSRLRLVTAVVAASSVGCRDSSTPDVDRVTVAPRPGSTAATGDEPRDTAPIRIEHALAQAHARGGPLQFSRVTIDYVAPDGMIDPAYGRIEVVFGDTPRADDPRRPTGAPARPTVRNRCIAMVWERGAWRTRNTACNPATMTLRCTVPIIWERAIAKGAPRDAVAQLTVEARRNEPPQWTFQIVDPARKVSFQDVFADDCGLIAEAPDASTSDLPVPRALDRLMTRNTIGTLRPAIRACGGRATRRGVVTIRAEVEPSGVVGTIEVVNTPDPALGACVREVVGGATFPRTQAGGKFSYPFTF